MRRRAGGFTYIGLLVAVVVMGIGLAEVGVIWRTQAQREREQELLYIGREFRAAVARYYGAGPHQFPMEIEDLLEDKRFGEPKHHLRKLYIDPMTGAADWTFIRSDLQGITGIASSSQAEPIKKQGFQADEEESFKDAACYCDWKFNFVPRIRLRRPGSTSVLPSSD